MPKIKKLAIQKAISSSAGEIKQLQSVISKSRENIALIKAREEEKIQKVERLARVEIEELKKNIESLREELDQAAIVNKQLFKMLA